MELPLWVPWLLVVALVLPVVVGGSGRPRGLLLVLLAPAVVAALLAVTLTVDRAQVNQEELDEAAIAAAAAVDGSYGPVGTGELVALMRPEVGSDLSFVSSDLVTDDPLAISYTIEVTTSQDEGAPTACFDVRLEVLSQDAPDVRLSDVAARSGACA